MGENTVTLNLAAATKAGTKAAFQSIADGFKLLGKEVRATAKDLLQAGKTGAADSMGHLAMAIDRVSNSSKEFAKTGKDTRTELTDGKKALVAYGSELKVVGDAFAKWSNNGKATGAALQVAKRDTDALAKSIASMGVIMNKGGASWESIEKWKNSLRFDKISKGMDTGYLKTTATGFQDISKAGMAFLSVNRELAKSFESAGGFIQKYQDVLRNGEKAGTRYANAVKELGTVIGKSDVATSRWAPALKKVHTTMENTRTSIGKSANIMNHWSHTTKMASVAQAVLAGDVKTTASGFQIMNEKGLKAFNGLTVTAADKLGILSKSFDSLSSKTGAQSITAYGKAVNESIGKTDKFSKGIQTLAGKYGVMSASFRSNYEDMKRSDAIWNKHVTTLQKTGQISEKTAERMRKGFSAVKVSAEQLTTTLARPNKQYAELTKTIDRVSVATKKSTADLWNQANALKASGKPHSQIINALNSSVGAHRELTTAQKQLEDSTRTLSKLRGTSVDSIRKVNDAIQAGAKSSDQLISVTTKRNQNLKDQIAREKEVIASNGRMESASLRLTGKYKDAVLANKEFQTALNNTVKAYGLSANAGKAAEQQLNRLNKSLIASMGPTTMFGKALQDVGQHIKSFASYATAATFIAGLVGTFTSGVTAVIEFDQALKDLQAITGATDREVGLMGETIKHVASTTKFSATEVADGMKTLGQAGLSAKESIETIGAVSDLATGTLSDMGTSVDLVTTAMRVFSIESYDSSMVADTFANAVNKSKLTIDKLRVAFNYVGPVAVSAGASFEEVNSAMMTLANSGMRASTIGTGLRQVLSGLVKPSEEFKKGVEKAGMGMEDFNLKSNSMSEVIQNLRLVVTDAEDAFKMFGLRGATAVSALIADNSNAFDKMQETVSQTGTAIKMAGKQMEGLGVRIKNMWDKSKNLSIALGETGLSGVLGLLVDSMRGMLDILTELVANPIAGFIVSLGITTTSLLALTMAVRGLAVTKLGLWFTGAAGAASGFTASVAGATVALKGFLLNPVTLGIIALGLAITGTVTALKSWQNGSIDAYDKAKNLSDELETLQTKMSNYRNTVATMSKSSDEFKKANLKLRSELEKVGERTDALGRFAQTAKLSINALNGTFLDGEVAVKRYYEELEKFAKMDFSKAADAAEAAIEHSLDGANIWYNNAKEGAKGFFGTMWGITKTTVANMARNAEDSSNAWEKLNRDTESVKSAQQRLNAVIGKFDNGKASYAELKEVLMDSSVAATELGQSFIKSTKTVEESTSDTITELVKLGHVSMDMTEQEVVEIAIALGKIKPEAERSISVLKYLFSLMKDGAGPDIGSFSAKWATELDSVESNYEAYIRSSVQKNSKLLDSFNQLDAKIIKGFEERKRKIAEAQIASDKQFANDKQADGDKAVEAQVRRNSELKRLSAELNKAMKDDVIMNRYSSLQNLEKTHAAEIAKIEAYRKSVSPKTYYTKILEQEQAFQKKREDIMGMNLDPKKAKEDFGYYAEQQQTALDMELLQLERANAAGKVNDEAYADAKLNIQKNTYKQIMDLASAHYTQLQKQSAVDPKDLESAHKRMQDATQKYYSVEIDGLKRVSSERDKLAEVSTKLFEHESKLRIEAIKFQEANNKISEGAAEVAIIQEKITTIDQLISKYTDLHNTYAENENYTERLNELLIEKDELTVEFTNTIRAEILAMDELVAAEKELELQHKLAKVGTDITSPGYDTEYKNLKQVHDLKMQFADIEVSKAQKNFDIINNMNDKLGSEYLGAKLRLQAAINAKDIESLAFARAISEERIRIDEEMWRKGELSASQYHATVKEAMRTGAISYEEGKDRMMASTNDMFAAFKYGWENFRKESQSAGESMQKMAYTIGDAMTEGLSNTLLDVIDGTKSTSEAFRDMARDVIKQLLAIYLKMLLVQAVGFIFSSSTPTPQPTAGVGLYSAPGMNWSGRAEGGLIGGKSPHKKADNIPIMATANEFVEPVDVVEHYGVDIFEALRKKLIPKELFSSIKNRLQSTANMQQSVTRPVARYATGGVVSSSASTTTQIQSTSGTSGGINVTNNITVQSGAGGTDDDKQGLAQKMAMAIKQEVLAIIIEQKRFGGNLYHG